MNGVEIQIRQALVEMADAMTAMQAGGAAPDLMGFYGRLDALACELPAGCKLRHYLDRKSYDKARSFLEAGEH